MRYEVLAGKSGPVVDTLIDCAGNALTKNKKSTRTIAALPLPLRRTAHEAGEWAGRLVVVEVCN